MCDGTGLTPKLGASGGGRGGSSFASAPLVTIRQLQRPEFQKDFLVVDIREQSQITETNKKAAEESKNDDSNNNNSSKSAINVSEVIKTQFPDLGYAEIPMGMLLSGSFQRSDQFTTVFNSRPKIALLCPRGGRAQVAADNLVLKTNYDVYVIKNGITSLEKRFATDDDWA